MLKSFIPRFLVLKSKLFHSLPESIYIWINNLLKMKAVFEITLKRTGTHSLS